MKKRLPRYACADVFSLRNLAYTNFAYIKKTRPSTYIITIASKVREVKCKSKLNLGIVNLKEEPLSFTVRTKASCRLLRSFDLFAKLSFFCRKTIKTPNPLVKVRYKVFVSLRLAGNYVANSTAQMPACHEPHLHYSAFSIAFKLFIHINGTYLPKF